MINIPDAPWIGLCREDYEDSRRIYDDEESEDDEE